MVTGRKTRVVLAHQETAEISRATDRSGSTPGRVSLAVARDNMVEGWFPVNIVALNQLRQNLTTGLYEGDRERFITDMRADFSVFAYILRELPKIVTPPAVLDPSKALRDLSRKELLELLKTPTGSLASSSFSGIVRAQASRVSHSLVSCTTADVLAQKDGTDPVLAYSAALMRQLGHNLIAWNYPRIYTRALAQNNGDRLQLEQQLAKVLGFSPSRLIGQLANHWRFSPELKLVIGVEVQPLEFVRAGIEREVAIDTGRRLQAFCEIGEAFAEVSDPEHFPEAAYKWGMVVERISGALGPSGVEILSRHIDGISAGYHDLAPSIYGDKLTTEQKIDRAREIQSDRLAANNPYLNRCSVEFQNELREAYRVVYKHKLSTEALQRLVGNVIPKAGFGRGCLYLINKQSGRLVPTLKIGSCLLSRYKAQSGTLVTEQESALTEALFCGTPIRQEGYFFGERVACMVGAVGGKEKAGVLYLELNDELARQPSQVPLSYFRAVLQAMNECLAL